MAMKLRTLSVFHNFAMFKISILIKKYLVLLVFYIKNLNSKNYSKLWNIFIVSLGHLGSRATVPNVGATAHQWAMKSSRGAVVDQNEFGGR